MELNNLLLALLVIDFYCKLCRIAHIPRNMLLALSRTETLIHMTRLIVGNPQLITLRLLPTDDKERE